MHWGARIVKCASACILVNECERPSLSYIRIASCSVYLAPEVRWRDTFDHSPLTFPAVSKKIVEISPSSFA